MAVIPSLPGIDVKVRVQSIQVTEHSTVSSAAPNAVTTYISVAPNTEFEVLLSITSEYTLKCPTLGFDIFVDGVKLAAKCCLQSKRGWMKEWTRLVQGAEIGELDAGRGEVRPFKFSKMGEGEIRVEVHRRDHGQRVGMDYVPEPEETGFKLGIPRPMAEPVSFWYAPLLDPEPVGVFKFIYRSEEEKLGHSSNSSTNTICGSEVKPESDPDTERKDGGTLGPAEQFKNGLNDPDTKEEDGGLAEQSTNRLNVGRIKREPSDDDEDFIHPKKARTSVASDQRTKAVFHWNGREVIWSSVPWFDSDDERAPVPVIKREREDCEGDENLPRKRAKFNDWDAGLYDMSDGMDYVMDY